MNSAPIGNTSIKKLLPVYLGFADPHGFQVTQLRSLSFKEDVTVIVAAGRLLTRSIVDACYAQLLVYPLISG